MTCKAIDPTQSTTQMLSTLKDQSLLQQLVALGGSDMKITVSPSGSKATPASATSLPSANTSDIESDSEYDRKMPDKVCGVDPYSLAVVNGKSIVDSVEMPSAKNNYTTIINCVNPQPQYEFIFTRNGSTLYKDGKLLEYKDGKLLEEPSSNQPALGK